MEGERQYRDFKELTTGKGTLTNVAMLPENEVNLRRPGGRAGDTIRET